MEPSIYKFILKYSRKKQVVILLMTVASFPFLYYSLDLPKIIINQAINAKDFPREFLGFEFEQIPYLLVLSGIFLGLVFVNSGFKYAINLYQGKLGERMLRRLRYQLYSQILRFPLPYFKKISQNEMIPMITAEVEPLGGFIGEAFVNPAFYGGTLVVIFGFMFVQDPILGLAAIALYPIQGYAIPKLQRRVNELAKQRVSQVRRVANRIGETVSGVTEIHSHDTSQFELARFSDHLGQIYDIRHEIYRRKFFIKFLNNFIAQLTPFFFYSIGGYLVIMGDLSFGSLVAVLAAYKDLTPPWKELLNHYQRRADARIKYQQVVIKFQPEEMLDEALQSGDPVPDGPLRGEIVATNLSFQDDDHIKLLDRVSFTFPLDQHIAIVGSGASGKNTLARLIARLITPTSGHISIAGKNLNELPESVIGRRMAYIDSTATIFSGTVGENLFYGLKHRPLRPGSDDPETIGRRERFLEEARASGSIGLDPKADWINYELAGATNESELIDRAMAMLGIVAMESDLYNYGLRGTINPVNRPDIADKVLVARRAVRERLADPSMAGLVEPFDPDRYNDNATMAENLLFGTPIDSKFDIECLADSPYVRQILDQVGLTKDLMTMGSQVAEIMVEMFSGLDPGHEFFEQYSFISSEDLPLFQSLLGRLRSTDIDKLDEDDQIRLLNLPFKLVPARHRLDCIDDQIRQRVLQARKAFADNLPEELATSVEFFEVEKYNSSATLLDNILFGKRAYGAARSAERVGDMVGQMVEELDLHRTVMEVGLDYSVGIAGGRLGVTERIKLAMARCLMRRPDVLVVNQALAGLDGAAQTRILDNLKDEMKGRGLIFVLSRPHFARLFDHIVVMSEGRIVEQGSVDELDRDGSKFRQLIESH